MVWYLVGAVVPVNVDVIHDAGVVSSDCLGHYPLEVPAGRVGFRVGGDVPDDCTDDNDDLKHRSDLTDHCHWSKREYSTGIQLA